MYCVRVCNCGCGCPCQYHAHQHGEGRLLPWLDGCRFLVFLGDPLSHSSLPNTHTTHTIITAKHTHDTHNYHVQSCTKYAMVVLWQQKFMSCVQAHTAGTSQVGLRFILPLVRGRHWATLRRGPADNKIVADPWCDVHIDPVGRRWVKLPRLARHLAGNSCVEQKRLLDSPGFAI